MTLRGTFENDLTLGPDQTVPATGEPVELTVNAFHRFNEQGQITDDWEEFDRLGFLQQLGVMPRPGAPAEATEEAGS